MTVINKKAFKGLPTAIRVRKPRYYYQDHIQVFNEGSIKDLTLTEFEGLDYEHSYSTLTFEGKELWNGEAYTGSTRALAPLYENKFVKYGGYSVVGSLTNENNVFSGFNGSNYLSLNGGFNVGSNTWEVVAKFTTTDSFPNLQGIYHFHNALSDSGRFGLIIRMQGNKFNFAISSGYSWMLNATGSYTLQPNTTYWVKASFDGSKYVLSYSLDGKFFIDDIVYASTSPLLSGLKIMVAGAWYSGSSYIEPLLGKLYLNECYIKISGNYVWTPDITEEIQQYNPEYLTTVKKLLYNVKGSPVVVNGVASGFSGSSYIQIPNAFKPANESWEFVFKVTTPSSWTQQRFFGSVGSYYKTIGGEFKAEGNFGVGITSNGSSWDVCWMWTTSILQVNTTYWIKVSFTGTQYKLELSTDGVEYTLEASKDSTALLYQKDDSIINIGYMGTETAKYFQGSIDLNESYLKVGSRYVWGKDAESVISVKGCLDEGLHESSNGATYNAFVKEDKILLTNKEDVEGMFWANKVTIPQHEVIPIYKKKFSNSSSDCTYSFSENNILISYKSNGYSLLNENTYYDFIPETSFFDYDVRFTAKVTTGTSGTHRIIGRVGVWFTWSSGKLQAIDKSLVCDGTLANNTTYWVRVGESYDVSTGQYIHRVCYIKDNGYTRETLPDESSWTVKSSADTTPWFKSTTRIKGLGDVDAQNKSFSWDGTIDLNNCWIDVGSTTNIGDNTRMYITKWKMLEEV